MRDIRTILICDICKEEVPEFAGHAKGEGVWTLVYNHPGMPGECKEDRYDDICPKCHDRLTNALSDVFYPGENNNV